MSTVLAILPVVTEWALALAAAVVYLSRNRRAPEVNLRAMRRLFVVSAAAFFALALIGSFAQYAAWKSDPLSSKLLPPYQPIGYFLKYAGTHFWLTPLLSLAGALIFYRLLDTLARANARFFESGEVELGALAAFLAGWPRIVIFLPAAFLTVVIISFVRRALGFGAYTTLGVPFLIGLAAALAAGAAILGLFELDTLAVIPGSLSGTR